jgi:hypothetical protein
LYREGNTMTISQEITDNLTSAITAWVTVATLELNLERMQLLGACLKAHDADVRVEVALREGSIILAAINAAGKRTELFRHDVEPLRPQSPFGGPESSGRH